MIVTHVQALANDPLQQDSARAFHKPGQVKQQSFEFRLSEGKPHHAFIAHVRRVGEEE